MLVRPSLLSSRFFFFLLSFLSLPSLLFVASTFSNTGSPDESPAGEPSGTRLLYKSTWETLVREVGTGAGFDDVAALSGQQAQPYPSAASNEMPVKLELFPTGLYQVFASAFLGARIDPKEQYIAYLDT
ncbi:hypothetical protein BDP81DRAFT_417507 [Colletotrichum phormii]|uniref:Uncharacterized protein n=1 Tax=Colletotrichum phormii TaxID=359342 RepID=A0AAJ0A2C6_9PEZI|nr:uncharacterized protein BDP81DRAFT_417507 [Colletotrichum phormii]KAK1640832.1 hypothetical protein BDP81DRAFT_417507 [Colletotrichum phormii]